MPEKERDFIRLMSGLAEGVCQTLLEMKKNARSIENTCDALLPMVGSEDVGKILMECRTMAVKISVAAQELYTNNAKEAFEQKGPTK